MTTTGKPARRALALALTIIMTLPMAAQLKQFTLEDLNFGGTNYHNMRPKNLYLAWWGDRLMYQDAEEWGLADMESGGKTPVATIDEVNKALGDEEIHSAMNATFPYPGEPLVLLEGSKRRVLYNWEERRVAWSQPCQGEQYSDWAAPSRAVAFVKDNQLCVTDAAGQTRQLTTDGSREIVYGQAVHRNEFGIVKGTFWSPDGTKLAFYRMDQSMVTDYPQVNTFKRVAELEPDKYPMAGMASHKVTVGVYDLQSGKTLYLDAGDPTDRYFSNVAWSPDSKTVYMIELNRDQTDFWLRSYDAATGKLTATLYHEHNAKYVHPVTPIAFLPWDDGKFLLQSERDGYNHLYLFDTTGRCLRQLTSGRWVVLGLIGFNRKAKSAIILSNEASPIQNNLYSVSLKTGRRTPIDNGRGLHARYFMRGEASAMLSESGSLLFDHYTEPDVPRNVCVTNTATGRSAEIFSAPVGGLRRAGVLVRHHQGRRRLNRPILPHGKAHRLRPREEVSHHSICVRRTGCAQRRGGLALPEPLVGDVHGAEGIPALHTRQPRLQRPRARVRAGHVPPPGPARNGRPDARGGLPEVARLR